MNIAIVVGLLKKKRFAYYLIIFTSVPAILQLLVFLLPFGLDLTFIVPTRSFYYLLFQVMYKYEPAFWIIYFLSIPLIFLNAFNIYYFSQLLRRRSWRTLLSELSE